ncbi:MAG: type IV pilus twitching motility protein PilT [Cystobacterineae bacterium]|nr:type IV pilus twitching motility protein PilT [Cystobacterineae bacterium]
MVTLQQLLKTMAVHNASDLHITVNSPPQLRIDGKLVALNMEVLNPEETKQICYSILSDLQKKKFEEGNELDFSFSVKGLSRFRANMCWQRDSVSGAFRIIPFKIKRIEELGLPHIILELAKKPQGLVLVTGPTGSGKSTTLAAIVDEINEQRRGHIVTVEDPIEYVHKNKNSIITQREVGTDTKSFKDALRYILRQDPDVILIGEIRDLETLEAALAAAETGHLVLTTLHTNSAVQTIKRISDMVPSEQRSTITSQLSFVLEGIISQRLLARSDGPGRVLAVELLLPNTAIRNLMRDDKIHQIYSAMQSGQGKSNMQTLNQSLLSLIKKGIISAEMGLSITLETKELRRMLGNEDSEGNSFV